LQNNKQKHAIIEPLMFPPTQSEVTRTSLQTNFQRAKVVAHENSLQVQLLEDFNELRISYGRRRIAAIV